MAATAPSRFGVRNTSSSAVLMAAMAVAAALLLCGEARAQSSSSGGPLGFLDNIFSAQAHLIDDTAVDDSLADAVAWVKDYVQDAGNIYGDAQHTDRLAFCRELLETLRNIETHGYTARWGRYATADDFQVGVLAFFKTAALETNEHFRIALVPRRLFSMAGLGR